MSEFKIGDRVRCLRPEVKSDVRLQAPGIVVKGARNPDEVCVQYGPNGSFLLCVEDIKDVHKTDEPFPFLENMIEFLNAPKQQRLPLKG